MCVLPEFLFPVKIPAFYIKYRSLYADISVMPYKWYTFYFECPFWVYTCDCRPVWPYGGVVVLRM